MLLLIKSCCCCVRVKRPTNSLGHTETGHRFKVSSETLLIERGPNGRWVVPNGFTLCLHVLTYLLTYLLTFTYLYSLIRSLTHSLTHSRLLTYLFYLLTFLLAYLLTYLLTYLHTYLLTVVKKVINLLHSRTENHFFGETIIYLHLAVFVSAK